jgi:3-carboxy-cis,cis-muconate cycloisomerase
MSSFIRDLTAGTPEMLDAFGDASLIRHALAFEAALARASAGEGLIGHGAAEMIASVCASLKPDPEALAREATHAGTLAIPLVGLIRRQITDPQIADAVHRGATSQDVADTALVLQMKNGAALIERDLKRVAAALRGLAQKHAQTPMIGRTLLQPALPITFGLKCANWFLAVHDDLVRFQREKNSAFALQLGGATGTRNGFSGKGAAVAKHMAQALGLASALPWHTRRNNVTAFASSIALLIASIGKIASDIALMAQAEIDEVAEPALAGRGGSSAMAHKRNPTGCQVALSAALRAPGLIATLLTTSINQHERGLGGWQAEAPVIAELFMIAHSALMAMATVLEGLSVNTEAMARHLDHVGVGSDPGEAEALITAALAARGDS